MLRQFTSNILLALGLLLAVLLVGEWAIRLITPQTLAPAYLTSDPALGVRVMRKTMIAATRPDGETFEVRTNELGFRMDEALSRSPERRRIPVYGGSQTFGVGLSIEDTFFRPLKTAAETIDPRRQLANAAAPSYGTDHVKILIERHLSDLKPAAIIYFLNGGDFATGLTARAVDPARGFRFDDRGRPGLTNTTPVPAWQRYLPLHALDAWLKRHSHLAVFTKRQAKRGLMELQAIIHPGTVDIPLPALPPSGRDDPLVHQQVFLLELQIQQLARLSHTVGVPMLLVWLPPAAELAAPVPVLAVTRLLSQYRTMLARAARDMPGLMFIDTVRLISRQGRAAAPQPTFWQTDGHFSAAGAAWYAALVKEPLLDFLDTASALTR